MQKKLVISTLGKLIMILGFSMLIPLVTAMIYREPDLWVFALCMPITLVGGFLMYAMFRTDGRLRAKDGFAIVTYGWLIASVFGMLPYMLSGALPSAIDAFLETMSGFTTTGATVFMKWSICHMVFCVAQSDPLAGRHGDHSLLFVPSCQHYWTGGMQIVKAEMPGPMAEKIRPRISDSAKFLWIIYIVMTMLNIAALMLCGFSLFDAITHAFSTVATGGFSTKTSSMGYYHNPAAEWVSIFFMFFAGVNFSLYYHIVKKRSLLSLWQSKVFQWYLWIVVGATALISINLVAAGRPILQAIRTSAFHVVSLITTTGFITEDYSLWPSLSITILLGLLLVGACAGSTGGGIKVDRWMILFHQTVHELKKTLHPRLVTRLKVDTQPVSDNLIINVSCFFFLYILISALATLVVSAFGFDTLSSFSVVVTCLGNVGPGLGVFGPTESLAVAPPFLKLLFSFLMLLGRLELFTVLVVLIPSFKRTLVNKED